MSDQPIEDSEVPTSEIVEDIEPFRVMSVASVTYNLPDPHPEVNLQETENPFRSMTVPVALADAMAIAQAIEQRSNPRPSTHELFVTTLQGLQVDVIATRILKLENGVYYAEVDLMAPRGRVVVPCRMTDGIVLALRQTVPAPVLCAESVLAAHY